MKKYLLIVLTIIVISGCDLLKSHSRYILEHKSEICATVCSQPIDTISETTTKDTIWSVDTVTYLLPDSIMMSFYFECDSNRKIILKGQDELQSKYGKLLYAFNNGKLSVTALRDSIEIKNKIIYQLRTNTIKEIQKVPIYVDREVIKNTIPFWVWLVFGASGIIIVYLLIRKLFI